METLTYLQSMFGYASHYLFDDSVFKIYKAPFMLHLCGVTPNIVAEDMIMAY